MIQQLKKTLNKKNMSNHARNPARTKMILGYVIM